MKHTITAVITAILCIGAATGKSILIIGPSSSEDCIHMIPHIAASAGVDIRIVISGEGQEVMECAAGSLEFTKTCMDIRSQQWDLAVFRGQCTDGEIKAMKASLGKHAESFALECDSARMGITRLISPGTVAANMAGTRLCSGNSLQRNYAEACCWFEILTGQNPFGNAYRGGIDRDEVAGTLQQCGAMAAERPGVASYIDEHWYLPFISSQWKGKKVVFLGDSITDESQIKSANDVYWHMLEKLLGIKAYVYGISGHQMSHILGQASKMEKDLGDGFDAIMIFVGTNDYNASIPLGDWFVSSSERVNDHGTDTTMMHRRVSKDPGTFRGRTNTVLDSLKSHFPGKQIILLTPIHRSWANFGGNNIQPDENFGNRIGLHIEDYAQCLKEASMIWSVPVIDMFAEAGIHPGIGSHGKYFRCPDGNRDLLHPNTAGHIRMAFTIAYRMTAMPVCFPGILLQ